jgi:hypothetical protein
LPSSAGSGDVGCSVVDNILDNEFMTSGGDMICGKCQTGRISGRCVIGKDSHGTGIHGAIWEDELLGQRSQLTASQPLTFYNDRYIVP